MAAFRGRAQRFRQMLRSGQPFVQPGLFHAQSAVMTQTAGFQPVGVSCGALSATLLSKSSVGLMTMTQVAQLTGSGKWIAPVAEVVGHPSMDLHSFIGFQGLRKLEDEFLPREELDNKYQGSIGFRL